MRFLFLPIPLLILVMGCGKPAAYVAKPVKTAPATTLDALTPEDTLNLKEGARWTYTMETQGQSAKGTNKDRSELTFEVARVVDKGNGKSAQIRVLRNDNEIDRQTWLLNSKGLYQTTGRSGDVDVAFIPPQPLLLFPAKDNRSFAWKGRGVCPDGKAGTMKITSQVLDPIEVDTEIGRKSGIAVESKQEFQSSANKGVMNVTTWYTPKLGIIRINQVTAVKQGTITTKLSLSKLPE